MTEKRMITTEQIGAELVQVARESEDAMPLSTKLFPYIFIASRKMSLRTISAWLQEKHGVSLSPAAISRALNNQELHLERLADAIAVRASYVGRAYSIAPLDLLFEAIAENGPSRLWLIAEEHPQPESESDIFRWGELHDLNGVWEPIPHEVQLLLKPKLYSLLQQDSDFEPDGNSDF